MFGRAVKANEAIGQVAKAQFEAATARAQDAAETVAKASTWINAALQTPELREGYAGIAMETVQSTPASFTTTIKADIERWGPIVKASGFTAEE